MKKKLLMGSFLFLVIGCSQPQHFTSEPSKRPSREIASLDSDVSVTTKATIDCQFIGISAITDILKNKLGFTDGAVMVSGVNKLTASAATLGAGDITKGRPDDLTCTTAKFKAATELYIEACAQAMAKPAIKQRLFPQGIHDTDQIYLSFVGREPTLNEQETLAKLAESLPAGKAEAGMCAAVASSLEAMIRI